jgi:hypothetical protein
MAGPRLRYRPLNLNGVVAGDFGAAAFPRASAPTDTDRVVVEPKGLTTGEIAVHLADIYKYSPRRCAPSGVSAQILLGSREGDAVSTNAWSAVVRDASSEAFLTADTASPVAAGRASPLPGQ